MSHQELAMSINATVFVEAQATHDALSSGLASDPAVIILKHAVKIWAREHGIAEHDLSRLTNMVVEFTSSAIRDRQREGHVDV
jgi:hypothetical protein